MHLDRGYDSSEPTRKHLEDRGLLAEISQKGKPAPLGATKRWVVEEMQRSIELRFSATPGEEPKVEVALD